MEHGARSLELNTKALSSMLPSGSLLLWSKIEKAKSRNPHGKIGKAKRRKQKSEPLHFYFLLSDFSFSRQLSAFNFTSLHALYS
jgi:hypothetical protein